MEMTDFAEGGAQHKLNYNPYHRWKASMRLFSPQDLVPLAQQNLGLRLTSNTEEYKAGGYGDAIPLSHLAGAQDIIEFVTLASLPELPHKDRMNEIYKKYKESDPNSSRCMPRLILYYAARHNIDDAKERLRHEKTAFYSKWKLWQLESEAKKLASFYRASKAAHPLKWVIDNLPCLAQELAHNFNEKLQLRLAKNWRDYATSEDMDYLFLSDNQYDTYQNGYDFNNYPLGKAGCRQFGSRNVVRQMIFLGGEARNSAEEKKLECSLFKTIRSIMKDDLIRSLHQLEKSIHEKLLKHPDYPVDFKRACEEMMALVARLQENEQLSSEESIDLMRKTAHLVDNPASYKTFLGEAKKYRMLAGGRLSAYMMFIAGWAAKIMTINHMGNAWIKLANEKLDLLSTTEQLASAGETCPKRM